MSLSSEEELEAVTVFLQRLGSPEGQARVMAAQLLKRAAQLAEAEGISKAESLKRLMNKVVEAREGNA